MLVSYNNTVAQLLGILSSHQQRDCPCRHCACLCYRRKGTTLCLRDILIAYLSVGALCCLKVVVAGCWLCHFGPCLAIGLPQGFVVVS